MRLYIQTLFNIKRILLPLAILLSLLAAGCGVYTTQCTDIPLIDHRGMVNLNGNVSLAHVQGNLSAGITDHLATAVSCSYESERKHYIQGMAGWYRPVRRGVLELYGGFGWGDTLQPPPARARSPIPRRVGAL